MKELFIETFVSLHFLIFTLTSTFCCWLNILRDVSCEQEKILKARPLHGNDRFSPLQTELSSLVHSSFHQFHSLQWLLLSGPKRLKENFSVFTVLKNVEQKEITYKVTACSLSFVFQNRFQVITPSVPVVLN